MKLSDVGTTQICRLNRSYGGEYNAEVFVIMGIRAPDGAQLFISKNTKGKSKAIKTFMRCHHA